MSLLKITEEELAYYASLERSVYAMQYYLVDCRHPGWCEHKYQLRRLVNELASRIEIQRAANLVKVLPKDKDVEQLPSAGHSVDPVGRDA